MNETVETVRRHTVVRQGVPASPAEAVPLGNGRLGGMFWMPDGDVCFQFGHTDYWRTGTHMDPEFGGYPVSIGRLNLRREPAFAPADARVTVEHSLAEAKATLVVERRDGRSAIDVFFDMDRDVLVVRWRESGAAPARAAVELQGWRESITAQARGDVLILREAPASTRTPDEEDYLRKLLGEEFRPEAHGQCTAAAVEGAAGTVKADGRQVGLTLSPSGPFDAVIRLATAFGAEDDLADRALAALAEVAEEPYDAMLARHVEWWRGFWGRSHLRLASADGTAERFEGRWYMLSYLMASSNRGRRPVKFNFGNWLTATDDRRPWGGGCWYYNQRDVALAMLPANHPDLARNLYDMYLAAAPLLRRQAEHLFGHGGLFVPETASPDGAMYLRDRTALYGGPTKFTQLIFSTGLEVALHLVDYARYTGNDEFCREQAYPFAREVVEFFRLHMPKADDGLCHVYPANAHETWWRVKDDICDLAGLRAVLPVLIRLSEAYGLDADDRPAWREFLERLAPLPKGKLAFDGEPEWENRGNGIFGLCCRVAGVNAAADMYAPGVFVDDNEMHNCHPVAIYGIYPFRITHVGSADRQTGINTFRENIHSFLRDNWAGDVIVPALLGLPEEALAALTRFADAHWETHLNYTERYGKVVTTLNAMCLQCHDDVLYLFPALPAAWDASFRLMAPGPVEVAAQRRGGRVAAVSVRPLRDQTIAVVNPWPGANVSVREAEGEAATLRGQRLESIRTTVVGPRPSETPAAKEGEAGNAFALSMQPDAACDRRSRPKPEGRSDRLLTWPGRAGSVYTLCPA